MNALFSGVVVVGWSEVAGILTRAVLSSRNGGLARESKDTVEFVLDWFLKWLMK